MINALVVGTRKCGTTWLYENFREDSRYNLSSLVKESGFFSGDSDIAYSDYMELFGPFDENKINLEIDTSICYSDLSSERIKKYTNSPRIVIILRRPSEYLVSRYIHSKRKGEINSSCIAEAVEANVWLHDEMDYEKIIHRFRSGFTPEQVKIIRYEKLIEDQTKFLEDISNFISGGSAPITRPQRPERVNEARDSMLPKVTVMLTNAAKLARSLNLHRLVNYAKSFGIMNALENSTDKDAKNKLIHEADIIVKQNYNKSLQIWEEIG